jgi:hypothetical protein
MNNVSKETHTDLSHGRSIRNFTRTNKIRKPIMGVKFVKKFAPPPSIAFLISAKASPIALNTELIAFKTTGKSKTMIKAKIAIKNFLSEAFVFDSKRSMTMYIIKNTMIVASINHITKIRGSAS